MSGFNYPGQTQRVEQPSGMRPATYELTFEQGTETIHADYYTIRDGRIIFYKDTPGERDYLVVTYRSDDVEEMRELDEL